MDSLFEIINTPEWKGEKKGKEREGKGGGSKGGRSWQISERMWC